MKETGQREKRKEERSIFTWREMIQSIVWMGAPVLSLPSALSHAFAFSTAPPRPLPSYLSLCSRGISLKSRAASTQEERSNETNGGCGWRVKKTKKENEDDHQKENSPILPRPLAFCWSVLTYRLHSIYQKGKRKKRHSSFSHFVPDLTRAFYLSLYIVALWLPGRKIERRRLLSRLGKNFIFFPSSDVRWAGPQRGEKRRRRGILFKS